MELHRTLGIDGRQSSAEPCIVRLFGEERLDASRCDLVEALEDELPPDQAPPVVPDPARPKRAVDPE